jgi:hypothetical protein
MAIHERWGPNSDESVRKSVISRLLGREEGVGISAGEEASTQYQCTVRDIFMAGSWSETTTVESFTITCSFRPFVYCCLGGHNHWLRCSAFLVSEE